MDTYIQVGLLLVLACGMAMFFYVVTGPVTETITEQEEVEQESQEVFSAMEVTETVEEVVIEGDSEAITMSEAREESPDFSPISLLPLIMVTIYLGLSAFKSFMDKNKSTKPIGCRLNLSRVQKLSVLFTRNYNKLSVVESNLTKLTSLLDLIAWHITSDEKTDTDSKDVKELLDFNESMVQLTKVICNLEHKSVMTMEWQMYLEDLEQATSSLVNVLPLHISDGELINGELLQTLKTSRDELRYIVTSYSAIEYLKAVSNL